MNNSLITAGFRVGITGGGGYLGKSMALRLAEEGAWVMILGRKQSKLKDLQDLSRFRKLKGKILYQVADVTSIEQVESVITWMIENWGGVDGWVNNAASGSQSLLLNLKPEAVSETLKNSLESVIVVADLVSQEMVQLRTKGSIVNISSMYGIVSPDFKAYTNYRQFHNPPAYGAAKAGIIQFTRYAACHLASYGIRVNTISPGAFPNKNVQEDKGFIKELESRVPLGRIGDPNEVAEPVIFLLSDRSSYITGHNLVVDGGWTAW